MKGICVAVAALFVLSAVSVRADQWDGGQIGDDNALASTANHLLHGSNQQHVMQGDADNDYARVVSEARHSYEVRLEVACPVTSGYVRFTRVDTSDILLQTASLSADGQIGTLRWTPASTVTEYVKGEGLAALGTTGCPYVLELYDTTLFAPRWNNSSSQITVVIFQNTTPAAVAGTLHFFDTGGVLLHTQAVSMVANGGFVLNTGTVLALQGFSGNVRLTHDAPFGAIKGKAVALEPATGFTFDTLFESLPFVGPIWHGGLT